MINLFDLVKFQSSRTPKQKIISKSSVPELLAYTQEYAYTKLRIADLIDIKRRILVNEINLKLLLSKNSSIFLFISFMCKIRGFSNLAQKPIRKNVRQYLDNKTGDQSVLFSKKIRKTQLVVNHFISEFVVWLKAVSNVKVKL